MIHRRSHAAPSLALAFALAAAPAWSQFAAPPASAAELPWARAYRSCTEAALMRHFAGAEEQTPPPPAHELVALAEHDCAPLVPLVTSRSTGDALVVQAIVGTQHAALMRRFHGPANVTVVPAPPAPPTLFPVGNGGACPHPDYPPAAVRAEARGTTRVSLTVAADGHVTRGEVVGASGPTREHRLLDMATVASFQKCAFPPVDDKAPRTVTLEYAWRLD